MTFEKFPKMARLSREIVITEKIDGTCGCIGITEDGDIYAGSRTRWITPADDNFGFAAWVEQNRAELISFLGPGRHFGEWWGHRIQRQYGLSERHFSLFNAVRWCHHTEDPRPITTADPRIVKMQQHAPPCCDIVPVLYRGDFDTHIIREHIDLLRIFGSKAAPGFMRPEGIVVFHRAAEVGFKMTLEKDDVPKSLHTGDVA